MLPKEKRMEVLEAFDLTKSFRAAGQLTGVDHHTVANAVAVRARGESVDDASIRPTVADDFSDKIAEWIERSGGKVRADVVDLCRCRHEIDLCRLWNYADTQEPEDRSSLMGVGIRRKRCSRGRHSYSPSKNASSWSRGRYRPGAAEAGVVRSRARSLIVISAWR